MNLGKFINSLCSSFFICKMWIIIIIVIIILSVYRVVVRIKWIKICIKWIKILTRGSDSRWWHKRILTSPPPTKQLHIEQLPLKKKQIKTGWSIPMHQVNKKRPTLKPVGRAGTQSHHKPSFLVWWPTIRRKFKIQIVSLRKIFASVRWAPKISL